MPCRSRNRRRAGSSRARAGSAARRRRRGCARSRPRREREDEARAPVARGFRLESRAVRQREALGDREPESASTARYATLLERLEDSLQVSVAQPWTMIDDPHDRLAVQLLAHQLDRSIRRELERVVDQVDQNAL